MKITVQPFPCHDRAQIRLEGCILPVEQISWTHGGHAHEVPPHLASSSRDLPRFSRTPLTTHSRGNPVVHGTCHPTLSPTDTTYNPISPYGYCLPTWSSKTGHLNHMKPVAARQLSLVDPRLQWFFVSVASVFCAHAPHSTPPRSYQRLQMGMLRLAGV